VYDLKVDRHSRIAENKPVKSKCTNLAFNPYKPVLLVGDSHGGVNSFKLSQYLAKNGWEKLEDDEQKKDFMEKEKKLMDEC